MKNLLLIFCLVLSSSNCVSIPQPTSVFVPVGTTAKVNTEGEMFGLRSGEVPFADSPSSLWLYMSARGVKDSPAIDSMVTSGRIIFLPTGSLVDVIEHNDAKDPATKIRIRSGATIGREMWTHPKFISSIK